MGCDKSLSEKPSLQNTAGITGDFSRVSVHDPCIVKDKNDSQYYVFGTHGVAARSTDLANWTSFTNGYARKNNVLYGNLAENLKESFAWAGYNDADCTGGFAVWAPQVFWNPRYEHVDGSTGAWMLYYCTSSTYCRSCIGYAVSDRIDGGYTYKGTLVYSGFTETSSKDKKSKIDKQWTNTNLPQLMESNQIEPGINPEWTTGNTYNTDYAPNAIDPGLFFDADGRLWMTYGSWSGGIFILEIDPKTGNVLYPGKNSTTPDGRTIDKYFGTQLAGGHTLSGEGPFVVYDAQNGWYYLYTTYNYLDSVSGYNMRLFRSKSPAGPYTDAAGRSAVFDSKRANYFEQGIKVMGNYHFSGSDGYRSPGHCSSFIDDDGQMYLFYHTRFENAGEHFEVRVHQQFVNEDGWPVTAVFENRGNKLAPEGYSKKEITGEYEFINHGLISDGSSVKKPKDIKLKSNGTVVNEYNENIGTWEEKKGSPAAEFVLNGITFRGFFFAQEDESLEHTVKMTFSAIGENNETIWGVKK